jgi:hypothetical protein
MWKLAIALENSWKFLKSIKPITSPNPVFSNEMGEITLFVFRFVTLIYGNNLLPTNFYYIRFEVFSAVIMNKYKYFAFLRNVRLFLVTTNVVPSSSILVTLMMKALSST